MSEQLSDVAARVDGALEVELTRWRTAAHARGVRVELLEAELREARQRANELEQANADLQRQLIELMLGPPEGPAA